MINQYNPFRANRAEQMTDLWKYYVPFPGLDETGKPLVVQGGRGSGKTMFFQCNSWRQRYSQIEKDKKPITALFEDYDFIGIYYRVDTTFVSSMCNREEKQWNPVFETYLSICILQDVLDLLICLNNKITISKTESEKFCETFSKKFNSSRTIHDLCSFRAETESYLDIIEDKINGIDDKSNTSLRWVNAHRIINDICNTFNHLLQKDLLFKIFIDEYETLQEYQQRIVNTLIKHSSLPVVFNIGLRPHGMKTNETISNTETIEAPHDYESLTLGIDSSSYLDILKKICQKRIALGKEQNKIPSTASEDIEYYLGTYSIEYELKQIQKTSSKIQYLDDLKELIESMGKEQGLSKEQIATYNQVLGKEAPLLNSRLHYALLCRKTAYTPSIQRLYDEYISNSQKYNDWMHNRKLGIVFLLCKDFKRDKLYYGFDVFASLSSNIVRYFLELCEQVFRLAFLDGYNWDSMIAPTMQSEAARYVSEYKILDIAGYEPYGNELRLFVQYLGQIFYKLHTSKNNTLGEPEPNHFNTKDLSLPDNSRQIISSAVMWNVLQEGEPTKRKQSKLSPETVDYYLNKIYVPYFGISYRNQRKIQIDVDILNKLLSGQEDEAKKGFRKYFRIPIEEPITNNNTSHQMTIFDFDQGGQL